MNDHSHGPWVDVHAHPGRCFLGGLEPSSPFVAMLGGDESRARVRSSLAGEVSVVNAATVADLAVLGVSPEGGLFASREFEPGEEDVTEHRDVVALRLQAQIARVKWDQVEESRVLARADRQVQKALDSFEEAAGLAARAEEMRDEQRRDDLRAEANPPVR